ncbi:hypothetical protein POPTR_005G121975v4 [Populus trichocarpa]|uniref:Uncharacterized protein n=1 Tax=Populus trichocarpa TaxID=3694 RepID=A0ACC0SZD9_POPTR|nr:hypothetical protein POPTR_005G121975v4 [Populus trichocarpa]
MFWELVEWQQLIALLLSFFFKAIKAEVSSELVTDFANIIFPFACRIEEFRKLGCQVSISGRKEMRLPPCLADGSASGMEFFSLV